MHPAVWTFVAMALLLTGLYELWRSPRRRVAHVLHMTQTLRDGRPAEAGTVRWLTGYLSDRLKPYLPSSQLEEMREKLLWAGQPLGLKAEEFLFVRLACALGAAMGTPLLLRMVGVNESPSGPMAIAFAVGYLAPEKIVDYRVEERTREIRIHLPMFVHLLATALEAGMPIVEAVRRVAQERKDPGGRLDLLGAEMLRTVQEMAAGKSSTAAWQHLIRRTNCQELREVVGAIIQSQELGVGVAEQLRFHMRASRTKKQQQASERAQAASVQMKIPIILLIVVPTLIILIGPAAMGVLRMMSGG